MLDDENVETDDELTDASTESNENEAPVLVEENPRYTISADLIRGHINTIILRTLSERDKYGYEIIDEIEKKSHGQYELKQPTLYSALKRLENQGYIKAYWKTDEISAGGRRKYFTLTDSGREVTERNRSEWEYSRTVIDSLISDQAFDFNKPAPVPVDFKILKQSTSRIRTVKLTERNQDGDENAEADADDENNFSVIEYSCSDVADNKFNISLSEVTFAEKDTAETENKQAETQPEQPSPATEPTQEPVAQSAEQPAVQEQQSEQQPIEQVADQPAEQGSQQPVAEQPIQQPVYEQPAQQPVYEQPVQPYAQQPIQQPVYEQPAQPYAQQPIQQPVYEQPVQPYAQQPIQQPVYEQPAQPYAQQTIQQPVYEQPVQPYAQQTIQQQPVYEQPAQQYIQQPIQQPVYGQEAIYNEQILTQRQSYAEQQPPIRQGVQSPLYRQDPPAVHKSQQETAQRNIDMAKLHENYLNLLDENYAKKYASGKQSYGDNIDTEKLLYNNKPETERDYKNLIDDMYTSTIRKQPAQQFTGSENVQPVVQPRAVDEPKTKPAPIPVNLNDEASIAESEGLKIYSSQKQVKPNGKYSKTYNQGETLFKCSAIAFIYLLLIFALTLVFKAELGIGYTYSFVIFALAACIVMVCGVMALSGYGKNTIKPVSHGYIPVSIVLSVIAIFIVCIVAILLDVDFSSVADVFKKMVIPSLCLLTAPLFTTIYYLFSK